MVGRCTYLLIVFVVVENESAKAGFGRDVVKGASAAVAKVGQAYGSGAAAGNCFLIVLRGKP